LIELEQQGAEAFFGEPSFEVQDLLRVVDGFGAISILRLSDMQNRPETFLLLHAPIARRALRHAPGNRRHGINRSSFFSSTRRISFSRTRKKSLLDEIETVIKLIRSKGVGIFFCTQLPTDIPNGRSRPAGNESATRPARFHRQRP
jgi:DNA helicase HerA-like ATPase